MFESFIPDARPRSRFLTVSLTAHFVAILLLVTIHFSTAIRHIPARAIRVTLLTPSLPHRSRLIQHRPVIHPQTAVRHQSEPVAPAPSPEPQIIAKAVTREFHAPIAPRPAPAVQTMIQIAALPAPEPPRIAIPPPIPNVEPLRIDHVVTSVKTGSFTDTTAAPSASLASAGVLTKHASGFSGSAGPVAFSPASRIISKGGFGDTTVAANAIAARKSDAPATTAPVEILSKPRPAYTAEARSLRIEGEVLLEIQFTAAGDLRVLRVAHGLGHGLDETASAAAREIRFRPARHNGAPVDSTAIVHIQFQLAY